MPKPEKLALWEKAAYIAIAILFLTGLISGWTDLIFLAPP